MNTNINLAAPVGALALLGTGFLIFVGATLLITRFVIGHENSPLHSKTKFRVEV